MKTQIDFDFLVIGGGSGGIAAAVQAAKLGQRVCLIEHNLIGGTCVNNGCVPKKIMWLASNVFHSVNNAKIYGINTNSPQLNWTELCATRQCYISNIHNHYNEEFDKFGITIIKGTASFTDNNTVKVADKLYTAKHIIIATGSKPKVPDVPGQKFGLTSYDFFKIKSQPKDIVIAGSGYIGVELACTLNHLGSKVTLLLRRQSILSDFDYETASLLQENMQKNGICILQNTEISEITKVDKKLCVTLKDQTKTLETHDVIWAIGRKANTKDLALKAAGIKIDKDGFIIIDENQKTSNKSVYAIGDVTNRPALTPVAVKAGRHLVQFILGFKNDALKWNLIPSVVFSHPPLASIGITEDRAQKENLGVHVYRKIFRSIPDKLEQEDVKSIVKIITCSKTKEIIGCHILGQGADEVLQGFAVAITMKATLSDLNECLAIHPTLAEELILLDQSQATDYNLGLIKPEEQSDG